MGTSGNCGGGRRSKGERRFIGSRLPVNLAERLDVVARHEGLTLSDMIAVAIEEKLAAYDVKMLSDEQLVDLLSETKMALDGTISGFTARKVVEQLVILNRDLLPAGTAGLSATSNSK